MIPEGGRENYRGLVWAIVDELSALRNFIDVANRPNSNPNEKDPG